MNLFKPVRHNIESITLQLLSALSVNVTKSQVKSCLHEHPGYPSLLSLSDCLSEWNLDNQGYFISKVNYDVEDLLFPFIAHLKEDGGHFILVHSINDSQVRYSDEINRAGMMSEKDFLDRWGGVAQHAEVTKQSGQKDYVSALVGETLKKMVIPLIIILFLLSISIQGHQMSWPIFKWLMMTAKISGVAVTILLLIQMFDPKNGFINKICGLGGSSECSNLITSKASKITTWLSWSEIGFLYFSGTALAILIATNPMGILAWINVFCLPYTIYSLTYQYLSRKWCALCCLVQLIILTEFVLNIVYASFSFESSFQLFWQMFIVFLIPLLIWGLAKPLLFKSSQFESVKTKLNSFRYNGVLFRKALTSSACFAVPDNLTPVILGNPNGKTVITVVSSPYCDPCGEAHDILEKFIRANEDLQVRILFKTAGRGDEKKLVFAKHIYTIALSETDISTSNAIHEWYTQELKNFDKWARLYPAGNVLDLDSLISVQREWCDLADVRFTPTILINGYKLPEPYSLEDIKYFSHLI
ncbi:thioredoxin domain-containing protein [Pedobacter petrophilus]|uniref:Thioredoxin domain-containing protein n=1 Tax=Pedobacter petrophilus TaxID=1908241 RepID=A0A7K0G283_9SPHI|nr:thioredoxin domain-containing protein [Pedobacter petrophilus]MRX77927.1 thioredoxin domain-containing protein [Pedobacter petrophilus]